MNERFSNFYKMLKKSLQSITIKTPFVNFTFAPLQFSASCSGCFFIYVSNLLVILFSFEVLCLK